MPLATDLVMMGIPTQQAELLGYGDQNPLDGNGTTQGTATPIPMYTTNVAMGTSVGDTAFILPAEVLFQWPYFLLNTTAEPALVYPPIGAAIDDNAVNAPITVIQDQAIQVVRIEDGRWVTWQTGRPPTPEVTAADVEFTPYPPITADNVQTAIEQTEDQILALAGAISGFVPDTRQINSGAGLTGGGDLTADRTIALNGASIASLALADTAVQPARAVNTGTGLTGGGNLTADRTIALNSVSIASLAKADSAAQLNVAQTWTETQVGTIALVSSSATITLDLDVAQLFRIDSPGLGVNTVVTITNSASHVGAIGSFTGYNNGTGGYTMGYAASMVPIGAAAAPAIPTGANAKWRIDFQVVSSTEVQFTVRGVGV
ncbi:hypothetical protein [Shinella sp. JR1-6]|uniref:hypothetical protein n=1 Tax=Shinella sp. JR1-6 TaxID=2527671 RepID=UPI00102D59C6|nr:hypothetical protein [Shinella sp. JR1-6]TAA50994.1 hypothetical protein EXZ48_32105 [Shinella sp. JR1-6]